MKGIFDGMDLRERIYFSAHLFLWLSLFWMLTLSTWPLAIMALCWLGDARLLRKLKLLLSSRMFGWGLLLFSAYALSLFFSENKSEAWQELGPVIYLFLIPLLYVGEPIWRRTSNSKLIFSAALIGILSLAIFAILRAIGIFFFEGSNQFFYKDLLAFAQVNPIYVSMGAVFGQAIAFSRLINGRGNQWMWLAAIGFLGVFILLLTARTGMICSFLLLNVGIALWLRKRYSAIRAILGVLVLNLLLAGAAWNLPYTKTRITVLLNMEKVEYQTSANIRKTVWQNHWALLKEEHFVFPVGLGDYTTALKERYNSQQWAPGMQRTYNAHNQYLFHWLALGLFGLLTLVYVLWSFGKLALKNRSFIALSFVGLIALSLFTEAMLNRQVGLVFFMAMLCQLSCFLEEEELTALPQ